MIMCCEINPYVCVCVLTGVAGGSSVSGPVADAAERVPGLGAATAVLTLVRYTPGGTHYGL